MKTRSIILLVLAGIFGLLLFAIIGLYLALRSPSVTAAFVPGLQEVLKDTAGLDTTFGEISVDLLGDIHLSDVTAKSEAMDIAIPKVTLDYSARELLSGRLVVHSFALDQPKIKMTMVSDGTEPPPPADEEPAKPLPQLIDHWLNSPDVFINLADIAINDADVDVTMKDPASTMAVVLNDLNFKLSTRHVKGELAADIALALDAAQPQSFTMASTTPEAEGGGLMNVAVKPHAALKAKIELKERGENDWQLLVNAPTLNIDANQLAFHSKAPDAELKAGVDAHTLAAAIVADIAIKGQGDGVTILPGAIDIDLRSKEQGLSLYQFGTAPDPENPGQTIASGMDLSAKQIAISLKDKTTSLAAGGDIKAFLTELTSELSANLGLERLVFTPLGTQPSPPTKGKAKGKSAPAKPIKLSDAKLTLASNIDKGRGEVKLNLAAKNIQGLEGLRQNPTVKADGKADVDFRQQTFALALKAGDQFGNALTLAESYAPTAAGHPKMNHNLSFNLTEALDRYFPKPLLRKDIGYYRGSLKGTTDVGGPVDLFALNIDRIAKYPAAADITLTLNQKKPGRSRMLVHNKPLIAALKANYGEGKDASATRQLDAALTLSGDDLQLKGLKGRAPVRLAATLAAPVDITAEPIGLPRAKASVDVKAGRGLPQTAALTAKVTNAPKRLGLTAALTGNLSRQLIQLLPPLAKAKLFGSRYYGLYKATGNWQGSVRHPRATILSFKPGDEGRSTVALTGKLTVAQTARGRLARLNGPITLDHRVNGTLKKGKLTAGLTAPGAQLAGLTSFRNLKLDSVSNYYLGDARGRGQTFATDTTLTMSQLRPDKKLLPIKGVTPFLNNLSLKADGNIAAMDKFAIKTLRLRAKRSATGPDNIAVAVKGNGSLKNLALQATGALTANFPKASIAGVGLQGSAKVPFSATANRNAQKDLADLALAIKPDFINFSVATPSFAVDNLTGSFTIDEQIIVGLKSKKAKFRYIQDRDPFKRVDYGRIEPFLQKENIIQADKISFGQTAIGPLRANLAVTQNHVTLPYIATELLDGWYVGKMFLDFKPSQLKLGYLGRITQLNLGKLMPGTADEGKRFSSRLGLELDINRALLEGKVDVTEIGRTQLVQVLGVLDPNREDPKLNQARTALSVGAPSYLGLNFQQGLMDMDIQFEAALVPNMNITGIPLTSFIEANLSPFKKTLSQLPLE